MADEATSPETLSENGARVGANELAGRKADQVLALLREQGWSAKPKRIQPGPETKLQIEVTYPLEESLFDGGEGE